MINRIKAFFTPPIFADEDKTRTARLLYVISEIGLAGAVILVFIFAFVTRDFGTRLISTSIAIPLLLLEMVIVRKGNVQLAAYFVVVSTWIGGNYTIIKTGGVQTVGFGINLIVVLEAGMLISLGAGLVFAGLSSLAGLGMAIAQTRGLLPPLTASQVTAWSAWSTQTLYLGLTAGLLYVSVNYTRQSLARSKRAEARLRGIIENAPDIILETDRKGVITLINRYQDRYLGKQVNEFIRTDDAENVNKIIEQAFATGEKISLEMQIHAPDDTLTWDSVRVGPIAQEGKVTSLAVITTDITERKLAENALRESEARYRGFLENIPAIIYIIGVGQEPLNPVMFESPQIEKLLGYSRAEFLKDPLFWTKLIHPDDQARVWAESERADQTGESFVSDYRIFSNEKRMFWLHDESVLVKDELGQPLYRLGVCTDITERKRSEEETQRRLNELAIVNAISQVTASQSELNALIQLTGEKLRHMLNVHGVFITLYDPKSNIISFPYWRVRDGVNQVPAFPLGSGLISWVIRNRQPLVINKDYVRQSAELGVVRPALSQEAGNTPKAWLGVPMQVGEQIIGMISAQNYEQEDAFYENDIRLWMTIAANVGIAIQNAQLYTAAQQELAERKKLIDELEARNAELELFVYTMSHDIKNPLITIRGFLGLLEKDALSCNIEQLKDDITRITAATDKMHQLVNDLINLPQIGRLMNSPENVSFGGIVQDALELVRERLNVANIRVIVAGDLPVVYGDRARLVEILQNLIDNAAKFMGNQLQPQIEIGIRGNDSDGKPIFFVRDNGIGIAPKYHERVFGLFNKLDLQTDGTGIGLTLVKRIVEVHGGRIWLESEPGKGSTFYFTLEPGHGVEPV